jgi:hypothetical protein
MLGHGLQLQMPAWVETVNGLDQPNRVGEDKIFEFDLWASLMQAAREELHLWHVGEDQFFANGCGDHGEIAFDSKWRPPIRRPPRWIPPWFDGSALDSTE